MMNRSEQSWPEGTAVDLSTLKEITAHGIVYVDPLDDMRSLQDAYTLLIQAKRSICNGTNAIWCKLSHAQEHLDKQMKELLKEEL